MRVSRFYINRSLHVDEDIHLEGPLAHYIRTVLRLKPGDPLIMFNGKGGEFTALVSQTSRSDVVIHTGEFFGINRQSSLAVETGLSLIKRDAMDLVIQKSTELNARKIQPLISANTSVNTNGLPRKLGHWQQISHGACEQCGLNLPPDIGPVVAFPEWVKTVDADLKLIANPLAEHSLRDSRQGIQVDPRSIAIAIGPEGGFTQDELSMAGANGFISISLGPRTLRTETAAITLLSLVQSRWGDLH
ncbi:MAG: 16S rRNA (uracil(1498)-N(3))-methyltransferase [bacterium]|nr:16S rRNA (uracil(1498)-N(3))-methyltransferase [Gammaproteobacteria bacterium]HIL99068.1 16S rRNA (uracil(1498)-N(3))-methyltransferase [Pseudomonadales bacterium]